MKLKISITEADILNGVDGDGCFCPIALAAQRAIPSLPDLVVGNWDLIADHSVGADSVPLPDPAIEFIEKFDDRKPVEPFEFEIDLPDDFASAGGAA